MMPVFLLLILFLKGYGGLGAESLNPRQKQAMPCQEDAKVHRAAWPFMLAQCAFYDYVVSHKYEEGIMPICRQVGPSGHNGCPVILRN